ncbi:MAG TPA: SDR family NAD(P)-dependent oxidoreductase [Methylomirabilota bacterium]|nr:SDR family NAD(P)-dependent oxidoreductase [Methylomirabilota bacterium]
MRLPDKVTLVTGAASGIGRAIALAAAREGARVAVLDLNADGAAAVAREITTAGGQAQAWPLDVTDPARVNAVVEEIVKRWSTVHVLVNCAGWDKPIPFVETTPDFWDRILAINLKGPIACTHAVLPPMIAQGYGKIVSIASDAGRVGSTGEAVYSAAKGGLIAFTKTIARETARHRINVNCVCPGPSDTPLFQKEFAGPSPKLAESLKRVIPWGRLGVPEDVAPAVVFLASDEAGYITGQTLSVSGGLTMM